MNKITINSNLVRGRLDTIPTEEGGKTSRNFQVLFFPDECPPPPKNWIKLTNSLDPFRVHASIFEAECILIRRIRSRPREIDRFSKNAKLRSSRNRYDSIHLIHLIFHNSLSDETSGILRQFVPKEKKEKKWKGKEETQQPQLQINSLYQRHEYRYHE